MSLVRKWEAIGNDLLGKGGKKEWIQKGGELTAINSKDSFPSQFLPQILSINSFSVSSINFMPVSKLLPS